MCICRDPHTVLPAHRSAFFVPQPTIRDSSDLGFISLPHYHWFTDPPPAPNINETATNEEPSSPESWVRLIKEDNEPSSSCQNTSGPRRVLFFETISTKAVDRSCLFQVFSIGSEKKNLGNLGKTLCGLRSDGIRLQSRSYWRWSAASACMDQCSSQVIPWEPAGINATAAFCTSFPWFVPANVNQKSIFFFKHKKGNNIKGRFCASLHDLI